MTPRRWLCLLAASVLSAALSSPLSAQEKFAVLVGVDDYLNYSDEPGGDLRGAERDALSVRDVLLRRYGVPEENVRLLLSLEATKAAIHEAITGWAAERTREGDLFIFYFAGHGSQALDINGDEEDWLDETLAPTDVAKNSAEFDLVDDELSEWLATIAGDVVVILDSCHSGSATRMTGNMRPRFLNRDPPPEPDRSRSTEVGAEPPPGPEAAAEWRPVEEEMAEGERSLVELAAASPNQVAMEGWFDSDDGSPAMPGGAFTYHLVKQLWRAPVDASYQDLMKQVVSSLKVDRFTQDPQLRGPYTESLFVARGQTEPPVLAAADEVEVRSVSAATAALSAGSDRGVTQGSLYGTDAGAVLRVTKIAADHATAAIVSGSPVQGESATLMSVTLARAGLDVGVSYLPPATRTALGAALADLEDVTLNPDEGAYPDLFVRISEDEGWMEVLGRDGGVRTRVTRAPGGTQAIRGVAAAIRKELAIKRLALLDNPAAPFSVDLSLAGDSRVFQEGDTIEFTVRSERAGYLTLIDLGMDGTVTVLHPNSFEDFGRLRTGEQVTIPGNWAVFTVGAETGLGMVRAIVTPRPLGIAVPAGGIAQSALGLDLADEIRDLLEAGTTDTGASDWASALVVYEVVEPR